MPKKANFVLESMGILKIILENSAGIDLNVGVLPFCVCLSGAERSVSKVG